MDREREPKTYSRREVLKGAAVVVASLLTGALSACANEGVETIGTDEGKVVPTSTASWKEKELGRVILPKLKVKKEIILEKSGARVIRYKMKGKVGYEKGKYEDLNKLMEDYTEKVNERLEGLKVEELVVIDDGGKDGSFTYPGSISFIREKLGEREGKDAEKSDNKRGKEILAQLPLEVILEMLRSSLQGEDKKRSLAGDWIDKLLEEWGFSPNNTIIITSPNSEEERENQKKLGKLREIMREGLIPVDEVMKKPQLDTYYDEEKRKTYLVVNQRPTKVEIGPVPLDAVENRLRLYFVPEGTRGKIYWGVPTENGGKVILLTKLDIEGRKKKVDVEVIKGKKEEKVADEQVLSGLWGENRWVTDITDIFEEAKEKGIREISRLTGFSNFIWTFWRIIMAKKRYGKVTEATLMVPLDSKLKDLLAEFYAGSLRKGKGLPDKFLVATRPIEVYEEFDDGKRKKTKVGTLYPGDIFPVADVDPKKGIVVAYREEGRRVVVNLKEMINGGGVVYGNETLTQKLLEIAEIIIPWVVFTAVDEEVIAGELGFTLSSKTGEVTAKLIKKFFEVLAK